MNEPGKSPEQRVNPKKAETQNRFTALHGATSRRDVLDSLKNDGESAKFVHIEAVVSDPLGIFYTRQDTGGLIAVMEVSAVSLGGVELDNLLFNSRRVAAVVDSLPSEITIHSWLDRSPEPVQVVAEDWHNEFLAEQERERNKMNADKTNWKTSRVIALEWRGDFSIGGPVGMMDLVKSAMGFGAAKLAKDVTEKRKADRHAYNFMAYFKPEMQIRRSFADKIEREVGIFNSAVNAFAAALTSEQNGVGAYKDFGSLVEQMNSPAKVLLQVRRLNAEEGLRALYELTDPHPLRRMDVRLPDDEDLRYGLHYILGKEQVNFSFLKSIACGENGEVKDPDLRFLGENGPHDVGGIPRQIIAVRSLPLKGISFDLLEALRAAGVPFTYRIRWNGMTKQGSIEWMKKAIERRKMLARRAGEGLQAEAMGKRYESGMDKDEGLLGMGSILIAINGVPMHGPNGTVIPGSAVLRKGLESVRKWSVDNQIQVDFLNADQPNAYYAMLPGAAHLDPLELIPIRSLALGKLLPLYSLTPKMPENSSSPGYPILIVQDTEGGIIERGLEVGSVGSGVIMGGMGSGKSYWFADIIVNFHRNQGRISQGDARQICIDTFEFGDGSEDGSSFNSVVRLLGGKVVQFGRNATMSDAFNPWDAPVRSDANGKLLGYAPETITSLTSLLVTAAGGHQRYGGPVTPDMEVEIKEATKNMGLTPEGQLSGKVRSLVNLSRMIHDGDLQRLLSDWFDPMSLGKYFPPEKDSTRSMVVNYNFPLALDPKIRAVLFSAAISRMEERGLGSGPAVPKLVIGDEVGQGLKRLSGDDDAVVESARRMLQGLYTNGRRFGSRVFIAAQEPGQILDMGPTLISTVQNLCTTYFLFTQTDETRSKELFRLSDAMLKELRELPKFHVGMIQEGQISSVVSVNPPYGHAARTTQAQERSLRTAMMNSGRWGVGAEMDLPGMIHALADILPELGKLQSSTRNLRFDRLIRSYEDEGTAFRTAHTPTMVEG